MILLRRLRRAYTTCRSCSTPLPVSTLPVCPRCSSISPLPSHTTHHQLLGIQSPNPFVIDLAELKKKFRAAQASVHPDVWAAKSSREQDLAHTLSSRVNEAYQTLLSPLARAEYILQLNGHPLAEHDQVQDVAFMADVMDARELIDDAEDAVSLEPLIQRNHEDINTTTDELRTLIGQQHWREAKHAAMRLRYLTGTDRAAKAKSSSLT